LGVAPLLALSIPAGGHGNPVYCAFIGLYVVAAFLLADDLHRSMVRLLALNEQNRVLVAQVQHAAAELEAANVRLAEAATTDALTGIANRRRFDAALTDETARAQREEREIALLLFDIDLFKSYNDVFGHQAGDVCLLRVAQALDGSLRRPADLVARYGGEEFAAILPHTSEAAAAALAERVCAGIAALAIANPGSPRGIVTVSVGVASFGPDTYRPPADFLAAADAALYAAKAAGRNCVRVAPSSSAAPIVRHGALLEDITFMPERGGGAGAATRREAWISAGPNAARCHE
jgi:diguanylate cyclase (GGDEF)-like protein